MTNAKFRVGDKVTYKGNRRLRRIITARYWQPRDPGWRYKLNEKGLRPDLAARWSVVESELILVLRGRERGEKGT